MLVSEFSLASLFKIKCDKSVNVRIRIPADNEGRVEERRSCTHDVQGLEQWWTQQAH